MLKRGDEIRLKVDDAAFEGRSVGRLDGFVIFIEGAVPGDVVTARVLRTKKNYAEAKVVAVEEPSPFRVQPRCKHFGVCGGCRWQHVDYQVQLRFKQQHVVDAFERIGGLRDLSVLPIIGSDEISTEGGYASGVYFYRNKMEFSFSDQRWRQNNLELETRNSELFLGLHVPERYDKVLEIEECHLQSNLSNRILSFARSFARQRNLAAYSSKKEAGYLRFLVIRQSKRTHELLVNLVTYDDRPDVMKEFAEQLVETAPEVTTVVNTINSKKAQVAYGDRERIYHGEGFIHERLGRFLFTISASSFFQTNTAQAEKLFEVARSFAELRGDEIVWDLYSGTGSIALFVSGAAREVVGIEAVASSVSDAERNAEVNQVRNCTFLLGDLKVRLTKEADWMARRGKADVMILDPPRSGMHPKVIEEIIELLPPRIVYVSCNPATQARDVKMLCAEKYYLVKLQPLDLFPHTYHVENVAQLVRR